MTGAEPLSAPMSLSGVLPASFPIATIAAILIRNGREEDAAIHAAVRLVDKTNQRLQDMAAAELRSSHVLDRSLQGAIEHLGVKGRAVREYVFARLGDDAPAFWQRAIAGERCFTTQIVASLEAEQRAVRAARLAKAAAMRREKQTRKRAIMAEIVAENQRETALGARERPRRSAKSNKQCAKKKAGPRTGLIETTKPHASRHAKHD